MAKVTQMCRFPVWKGFSTSGGKFAMAFSIGVVFSSWWQVFTDGLHWWILYHIIQDLIQGRHVEEAFQRISYNLVISEHAPVLPDPSLTYFFHLFPVTTAHESYHCLSYDIPYPIQSSIYNIMHIFIIINKYIYTYITPPYYYPHFLIYLPRFFWLSPFCFFREIRGEAEVFQIELDQAGRCDDDWDGSGECQGGHISRRPYLMYELHMNI